MKTKQQVKAIYGLSWGYAYIIKRHIAGYVYLFEQMPVMPTCAL